MIQKIVDCYNWLVWGFGVVFDGFATLVGWIVKLFKANVAAAGIFIAVLVFGVVYVVDGLNWIITVLPGFYAAYVSGSGITAGSQIPAPLADVFNLFNAIIPLSEFFGCVAFLLPWWIIAITIRSIKAWLPTLT